MNSPHLFRTENKFKSHEKVCKSKDFYGIVMLSQKDNILQFNQYMKIDKVLYWKTYAIYDLCWPWIFDKENRWMCN